MATKEVLRWRVNFKYNNINLLVFADKFVLNDEWSYLQVNTSTTTIKLGYGSKNPQINHNNLGLILYRKYQIYNLYNDHGTVIMSSKVTELPILDIPNLAINDIITIPYSSIYRFNFDFHVLLTVISSIDEIMISEKKELALNKALCYSNLIKFNIYHGIIAYTGDEHETFDKMCKKIHDIYLLESRQYIDLLSKIKETDDLPQNLHQVLDYELWYKASRENQRIWPMISRTKINNKSLKFRECWYTPSNNGYIKLVERYDDNPYIYLPRQYIKRVNEANIIPNTVYKNETLYKRIDIKKIDEKKINNICLLDIKGKIVKCSYNAIDVIFNSYLIGKIENKIILPIATAQLLDKNWNRVRILVNNQWIDDSGIRIANIITIPWYYKQIIHDYNHLNRLEPGELMDLMHIGICDENSTDKITFPVDPNNELYYSGSLETHKLCTFKYKYGVYDV